ncbi:hypothetical protein VPHK250G1_0077 [Vibrio phage K250 g1]
MSNNVDNGNMPAMPTQYADLNANGGELYCDQQGMTKREMFAKDSDVSSLAENFDNYKDMASFVGESWNSSFNTFQNANLKLKVIAKLKVMAADALLSELSKSNQEGTSNEQS